MTFLTQLAYLFQQAMENRYIVHYTCERGTICEHIVSAAGTSDAAAKCREEIPEFQTLIEIHPYFGD